MLTKYQFDPEDWQGRSKRQVENSYREFGIAIAIGIIICIVGLIFC